MKQAPSSLRDTDKGLTHIPKLFLQEADTRWMKTTDSNTVTPNWLKTENGDAHNLTLMPTCLRIAHELLMHPTAPYLSQPLKR